MRDERALFREVLFPRRVWAVNRCRCAATAAELTPGGLCRVREPRRSQGTGMSGLGTPRGVSIAAQKSAEGIVGLTSGFSVWGR